MRSLLLLALVACGKGDQETGTVIAASAFADVVFDAPPDFSKSYDPKTDSWKLGAGTITVTIDRADERYVASPDAYMQHIAPRWKGKLVTIESRDNVRVSGFAMTLGIYAGEKDPNPQRVSVVVGKLGNVWYRCVGEGIPDEAMRAQVVALCRSVRRGEAVTPEPGGDQKPTMKLARLKMTVPEGWSVKYDEKLDQWIFEAPKLPGGPAYSFAYIAHAPVSAVASPEAYVAYLRADLAKTTKTEIASRSSVKDGFAMTVIIQAEGGEPSRTTVVVRQLGSGWYRCYSTWIVDDAIRDQLLALCKSLKL